MAGPLGKGSQSKRHRVFVLVDKGVAQGVFVSWDAAETFADENRLSLDQLMEYETSADFPDHLHLLTAKWDGDWTFQGEWKKTPPNWPKAPEMIRLEHYHAKGNGFQLFRQKEFLWEPGLLGKINPMAPDEALKPNVAAPAPPAPKPRPKLTPLKPLQPIKPLVPPEERQEPPPPAEKVAETKPQSSDPEKAPNFPKPEIAEKPQAGNRGLKLDPEATKQPKPQTPEEAPESVAQKPKAKISFQKKPQLRLKSKKGVPEPIPSFKAAEVPAMEASGRPSSVELAQLQHETAIRTEEEKRKASIKVRRVWSIRLILTVVVVVICWIGGTLWALRPEPTAASIIAELASLKDARLKIMEPEMVFFQLPVDPAHQERWIQSLRLQPVPENELIPIPNFHSLDTWEKPDGFIRPPYSETEVEDWWRLRLRPVKYGFTYRWDDGTLLILDLESDTLIGWAKAQQLPELLN